MKLRTMICLVLVLILLWGCAPAEAPTTDPTTVPTTGPAPTSPTSPTTEPTTEPVPPTTTDSLTMPTTEPTVSNDPFAQGSFNQITVYPFNAADLDAATNVLKAGLATTASKEGVLEFQVHWIGFDPYGTSVAVRNQMAQAPVAEWSDMDYYGRKMVFVVNFSVDMDETKSSAPDYDDQLAVVTLTRDTLDGQWKIDAAASAPETFCVPSQMLISPEILTDLGLTADFTLAGYRNEDADEYVLYVLDPAGNQVICRSYNAVKPE